MPTPVRRRPYTTAEWDAKRPLITRLYTKEKYPLAAVSSLLQREGFHVNERMLKTRIGKWKLDKKLKLPDMRTAMQLVVDNGLEGHESNLMFLIRGRAVPFSEVQRYFIRKGIPEPLEWLRSMPEDGFVRSNEVELVGAPDTGVASGTSGTSSGLSTPPESNDPSGAEVEVSWVAQDLPGQRTSRNIFSPCETDLLQSLDMTLTIQPFAFRDPEKLIYAAKSYCAMYLTSERAYEHGEPAVHHLTTHAVFAQRMQDGISLLLRQETNAAFEDFNQAFALLREVVTDNHPMAISLVLSIVCELESRNLGPLMAQLLQHTAKMCQFTLGAYDPLTVLFKALAEVHEEAIDTILLVVRRTADSLAEFDQSPVWKSLYLQERLCDCLYYASYDNERASKRRALLRAQDELYGPNSRNVLWTLTNVADDCLQLGAIEESESFFDLVLMRSQSLTGYGRAKSRFAALEGLAKCALERRAALETLDRGTSYEESFQMDKALRLLYQAESEARIWFPSPSRRTARVQATIRKTEALSSKVLQEVVPSLRFTAAQRR